MVRVLLDTNILIDHLSAVPQARAELRRYAEKAISVVTWMEVMVGADAGIEAETRAFLANFNLVGIDDHIAERAVSLRRNHRIRLPDAVIWATAQVHGMLLVTRNTKDFPANEPGIRAPYVL